MSSSDINPILHFFIGGVAGAAGAIATSPLEFLKTRLQSTTGQQFFANGCRHKALNSLPVRFASTNGSVTIVQYFGHIYRVEGGIMAFYKGLRPSLMGIIPARAVYFVSYSHYKQFYNRICRVPNSNKVHLLSAISTGLTMSTITSPLWVIKTKMQLDTRAGKSSPIIHYIQHIWRRDGFRGLYRGLTASYAGSLETGAYFVVYERLKIYFANKQHSNLPSYIDYFLAASAAKLTGVLLFYPHEVIRTRLRQDSFAGHRQYRSFVQTLLKVWSEERLAGLYGGMSLHLLRAVPNTAITFLTYEAIVSLVNF
ncbi:solute carrier family 25 member 36-A-like [Dysidea avara]|uniref:solute carrier family 25 member 36-A-like n=1 Tax=Dysidea avara TaxID=196820 RepID=UPI003326CD7B